MSHVPLSIDLIHNGVNDTVLLKYRCRLLESGLHGVLLFNKALSGGLLSRLQQQDIYNVLHARLDLILDLDNVIYAEHLLTLVIFYELTELLEQLE